MAGKCARGKEKNNPFINRLKEADPELYEEMKKYGRRNIAEELRKKKS